MLMRLPVQVGVLFLVLGADNFTSICTGVLLLVLVQMLVLVLDGVPTEWGLMLKLLPVQVVLLLVLRILLQVGNHSGAPTLVCALSWIPDSTWFLSLPFQHKMQILQSSTLFSTYSC